jgi:menaquinone-dependent protoporphyrinogen oxidase
MNTLILYSSNHGTTADIAERLSKLIGYNRCRVHNIREMVPPSLEDYDTVIIGGSIHYGRIQKAIKKYCEKNLEELLTKRVGLFICYMEKEKETEEYLNAFPAALIQHAHAEGFFGGEFRFDQMNFVEKMIVRKTLGFNESVRRVNSQSINHFAMLMQQSAV